MTLIPNGPETDQGARHALSLRRHILARSPTLDDLAAVAVEATGALMAVITFADRTTQYVVGACNCTLENYPRTSARYEQVGEFFEVSRIDESPAYAGHPLLTCSTSPLRSSLITGLFNQGVTVGGISVGSSTPENAFSLEHRAIIFKLARVAESVIRSEVTLSRMATEALAVLTGEG